MLDKKYNEVFKNTNVITRHVAVNINTCELTLLDISANDVAFVSKHDEAFSTAQYKHCYVVRQYYTHEDLSERAIEIEDEEVEINVVAFTFVHTEDILTDDMLFTRNALREIVESVDYEIDSLDEIETMLIELY